MTMIQEQAYFNKPQQEADTLLNHQVVARVVPPPLPQLMSPQVHRDNIQHATVTQQQPATSSFIRLSMDVRENIM